MNDAKCAEMDTVLKVHRARIIKIGELEAKSI